MPTVKPAIHNRFGRQKSAKFASASSQYGSVAVTTATGVNMSGDRTIEWWTKMTSLPSTTQYPLGIRTTDAATNKNNYYFLYYDATTEYRFYVTVWRPDGSGAGNDYVYWVHTPTTGVWRHYAWSWNPSQTQVNSHKFYVDGVDQGSCTIVTANDFSASNVAASGANFVIGALRTIDAYYNGQLSHVRVWNTVRTQAQIRDNRFRTIKGSPTGLVSQWALDNAWTDSVSSYTLSASGSPTFPVDVPFL